MLLLHTQSMSGRAFGAAAFVPLICVGVFAANILIAVIAGGGQPDDHLLIPKAGVVAILVVVVTVAAALTPRLVAHARENELMHPERRKRWVFVLRYYAPLTLSIYWWRHVRQGAPFQRR